MKPCHRLFAPLAALALAQPASADTISGSIVNHNDVAQIPMTLTTETDLTIWTNSFGSGGFDPILSLWFGGNLVAYNDDAPELVDLSQGGFDSLLRLTGLAPGSYLLTVSSFNNFPNGTSLSAGFRHDGATPTPIGEWWTAGSGNYNVHWTFGPISSIPEPSSFAMLLAGLGIATLMRRYRG